MRKKALSTVFIALRVPQELRKELEKLAEQERRSFSDYVKLALWDHVQSKKRDK